MTKFEPISDIHTPETGGADPLNDTLYVASERVRKALKQDLKECPLSREEVAIRLSERMGRVSSVAILDAYIAESKTNRFPAEMIPAWIEVTKSRRLLDLLCGEVGLSVATEEDQDFADLGRAHLKSQKLMTKLSERV